MDTKTRKQDGTREDVEWRDRYGGPSLGIGMKEPTMVARLNRWLDRRPLRAIVIVLGLVLTLSGVTRWVREAFSAYQASVAASRVNEAEAAWREKLERQVADKILERQTAEMRERSKVVEAAPAPQAADSQVNATPRPIQQNGAAKAIKEHEGERAPSAIASTMGLAGESARGFDEASGLGPTKATTTAAKVDVESPNDSKTRCTTLGDAIQNADFECGVRYTNAFSFALMGLIVILAVMRKAFQIASGEP